MTRSGLLNRNGQDCLHFGAPDMGGNLQPSSQLIDAFPHAQQTQTECAIGSYAAPFIGHLEANCIVVVRDDDPGCLAA